MKKRLIALCLALAFVLAALPGNLVSLAADSLGDLVGDEAVGVWGDFSEWVIMEATASFKTDSATLYYNPGTQPNNTVTLTGDDVPASFRVEYMLPLTAADGTVSYWYVLNTEEWAAFAGADACPPYVRVEDVTDLTYLEVQGAADGVSAEFEKVDASTAPEEVDTSHMSGVTSIRGYDISLKDANGATWQPKDNGTTVTVRVYDAWDITVANPIVDIYHVHGDGTVEVLSNTTGAVTLWPDGSISFETDSFSEYYVVLGYGVGDSLESGKTLDVYVEPGETISFSGANTSANWSPRVNGIEASGRTVTIGANVPLGTYSYTVTWETSGWFGGTTSHSAPVNIHVSTRRDVIKHMIESEENEYGVLVSLLQPSGTGAYDFPSEPGSTRSGFYNFGSEYQYGTAGWFGPAYVFSESDEGIIDPKIADYLVKSVTEDAKNFGAVDATGEILKSCLHNIRWDKIMEAAIKEGWRATDGKKMNDPAIDPSNYTVIPYVAKWMDSDDRWHIDCAIVYAKRLTLSYNLNLDNYTIKNSIELPDPKTGVLNEANTSLTVNPVGAISGLGANNSITASYNGSSTWTLEFVEWNTKPDGSGDSYGPNDKITISENTTLYAIWKGNMVPGDLYVYKDVEFEGNATETTQKYQFTVEFIENESNKFADAGSASTYAIYNAENQIQGTITTFTQAGTIDFELERGWYIVFRDVPANTKYKLTEIVGEDAEYTSSITSVEGSIRNGGTVTVEVVNTYEAKAEIEYVAGVGGSVTNSGEIIKATSGTAVGSTARPNDGYKFVGWYKDQSYTQPVDAAWVSGNKITPQKNNEGKYVTATYYAKFEPDVTSLTINKVTTDKAGNVVDYKDLDKNQTFIFNVSGNGVDLDVTVHGNGSVTIDGLTVGATYTITEKTDWSWRYEPAVASQNKTLAVNAEDNVVTFTNTRPNEQWLDGDSWCDNRFN